MINLLPTKEKSEIKNNYTLKLVVIISFLLGVVFLSMFLIFLSFFMIMRFDKNETAKELELLKKDDISSADIEALKEIDYKLFILGLETDKTLTTDAIKLLLNTKSEDIEINRIKYLIQKENTNIQIEGNAETREKFLEFIRNIQKEEIFSDVESPISDLGKSKDIKFTINIQMKTNEKKE